MMNLIDRILTPRQTPDHNDVETRNDDFFRIRVQNVGKKFVQKGEWVTALHDVSIDVLEGEFLAIVGNSGAGKTTLLNILAGWEQPTTGQVRVFNRDPFIVSSRASDAWYGATIGYVPQKRVWMENLCVMDALEMRLAQTRESRTERRDRIMEVLETLRLRRLARLLPAELTVSEQLKLAVAGAIVTEPRLLLLDQLGGTCDSDTMLEILEVVKQLNQRRGTTVIVSTTSHTRVSKYAITTRVLLDGALKPLHDASEITLAG